MSNRKNTNFVHNYITIKGKYTIIYLEKQKENKKNVELWYKTLGTSKSMRELEFLHIIDDFFIYILKLIK